MTLTIEDLTLAGSDEPFYLRVGEQVQWIKDNGDGTALVRVRSANGWEDVIDADIREKKQ
jgi:hypothetical protein